MEPDRSPRFRESPTAAWVQCEETKEVGELEVACLVERLGSGPGLIIAPKRFVDADKKEVWALWIGDVPSGRLMDFPSGDRLAVPKGKVRVQNGSSV